MAIHLLVQIIEDSKKRVKEKGSGDDNSVDKGLNNGLNGTKTVTSTMPSDSNSSVSSSSKHQHTIIGLSIAPISLFWLSDTFHFLRDLFDHFIFALSPLDVTVTEKHPFATYRTKAALGSQYRVGNTRVPRIGGTQGVDGDREVNSLHNKGILGNNNNVWNSYESKKSSLRNLASQIQFSVNIAVQGLI